MDWTYIIERDGVVQQKEGSLSEIQGTEPFVRMAQELQRHPDQESARLSATVQRSLQYGEVKVGFTITVSVPQSQQWMDYAAEHLFLLATRYVNDGMSTLVPDVPPLHNPPPRSP